MPISMNLSMVAAVTMCAALLGASPASAAPSTGFSVRATHAAAVPLSSALEINDAVAGTPPAFDPNTDCSSGEGTYVCFQKDGDKIWVEDTAADGVSADGRWENYLWDGSNWTLYRQGACLNKLSYGHWGYCDKDFYEDTSTNHYGSKGSGIRLYPCGAICDADYQWIRNNA